MGNMAFSEPGAFGVLQHKIASKQMSLLQPNAQVQSSGFPLKKKKMSLIYCTRLYNYFQPIFELLCLSYCINCVSLHVINLSFVPLDQAFKISSKWNCFHVLLFRDDSLSWYFLMKRTRKCLEERHINFMSHGASVTVC